MQVQEVRGTKKEPSDDSSLFTKVSQTVFAFLGLAVYTAVDAVLPVGEFEDMVDIPLLGSDASGVLAVDDVYDLLRKLHMLLLDDLIVLDVADRDVRVHIAQYIQIDIQGVGDLQDVFLTHLVAGYIFDDRHAAVQLVQPQVAVDVHASSGFDVIQNDSVFNAVNLH